MKKYVIALLKVKSIVTLSLTAALIGMLFAKTSPPDPLLSLYCTAYGAVIAYFFTKQGEK